MVEDANVKWKLLHQHSQQQVIVNIASPSSINIPQPGGQKSFAEVQQSSARIGGMLPGTRSPSILEKVVRSFLKDSGKDLMHQLLDVARTKGGAISVTDGVQATGKSFKKVEKTLNRMLKSGYVDVGNDPETGVVVYTFRELN